MGSVAAVVEVRVDANPLDSSFPLMIGEGAKAGRGPPLPDTLACTALELSTKFDPEATAPLALSAANSLI